MILNYKGSDLKLKLGASVILDNKTVSFIVLKAEDRNGFDLDGIPEVDKKILDMFNNEKLYAILEDERAIYFYDQCSKFHSSWGDFSKIIDLETINYFKIKRNEKMLDWLNGK